MNAKTGVQEPQRPSKRQVNTRLESEDWWIAAIEQEIRRYNHTYHQSQTGKTRLYKLVNE